jgi:hypothetical protein
VPETLHRKRQFHSAASITTGHSAATVTTLDILGRDGQQDSLSSMKPDLASLVVTEASLSGVWRKVLADERVASAPPLDR